MDPKEEWEKFLRGELPPGQLPISEEANRAIREITSRAQGHTFYNINLVKMYQDQQDFQDAHLRAISPFTRAMSDKMLADCLSSNRAK